MNLNFDWRLRRIIDHIWGPAGSILFHVLIIVILLLFNSFWILYIFSSLLRLRDTRRERKRKRRRQHA